MTNRLKALTRREAMFAAAGTLAAPAVLSSLTLRPYSPLAFSGLALRSDFSARHTAALNPDAGSRAHC